MSQIRDRIINSIIDIEGGYVNDPSDSGGETKYGITKRTAKAYGYTGNMKNLSRDLAFTIYVNKYWNALNLDVIEEISPRIAEELADTSVNMGSQRAAEFLQRSLNVLNNRGEYYPDLKIDRDVGPRTIHALRAHMKRRGQKNGQVVLFRMLNCLQGEFYINLCERREKDEKFIYGWFLNRVI